MQDTAQNRRTVIKDVACGLILSVAIGAPIPRSNVAYAEAADPVDSIRKVMRVFCMFVLCVSLSLPTRHAHHMYLLPRLYDTHAHTHTLHTHDKKKARDLLEKISGYIDNLQWDKCRCGFCVLVFFVSAEG